MEDSAGQRILVLCTGNSARSQMAAGFLRSFNRHVEVYSAGMEPSARVNPHAVAVMKEVGIDLSDQTPRSVSQFTGQAFDHVITVCGEADRNCPNFSGKIGKRVHIGFPDPADATGSEDQILAVFRQVRDEIRQKFFQYYETEISRKL
jgi:arsenate reductase (thioredoxin)